MKLRLKALIPAILLGALSCAIGADPQAQFDAFERAEATKEWKPNPALWQDLLSVERDYPTVSVGRGEFVVRGPLVETFRRPREWSDLSLGQKVLSLPLVNLFVPMKMQKPPGGGGKYFAWGPRSQAWTPRAPVPGFRDAIEHQASGTLISIGR